MTICPLKTKVLFPLLVSVLSHRSSIIVDAEPVRSLCSAFLKFPGFSQLPLFKVTQNRVCFSPFVSHSHTHSLCLSRKSATKQPSDSITSKIEEILSDSQSALADNAFIYQAPDMQWYPSDIFTVDGFVKGLRVMYQSGVAN